MKKLLLVATTLLVLSSLTACIGVRGHEGNAKVCKNQYFMGISLIEQIDPCGR